MRLCRAPGGARTLIGMTVLFALAACTRSEWLLSYFYNGIDDRLQERYAELAEFNEAQQRYIAGRVDRFHYWHRRVLLPEYARLLDSAAGQLRGPDGITPAAVDTLYRDLAETFDRMHQCNPLTRAAPFLVSLGDRQVEQIEASLNDDLAEERERFREWEREETVENAFKWFSRLGLELTDAQKQHYRETYAHHHTLWGESIELDRRWNNELITLLRVRKQPGVEERLGRHLDSRHGQVRRRYPERYQSNIRLWKQYAHELLNNLEPDQKTEFLDALEATKANLIAISGKGDRPDGMPGPGPCGIAAPAA